MGAVGGYAPAVSTDHIRPATPDDLPEILRVCGEALGWSDPSFDEALFRWKHVDNAFGPSFLLVSESDDGINAVRPMMRWRFRSGTERVHAVRAVDTATHPSAQGRGLFTRLTNEAIRELDGDADLVFNTPNDKSRPGYLKLGWQEYGRIAFGVRFAGVRGVRRSIANRTPATKTSIITPSLGVSIDDALSQLPDVSAGPSATTWTTDHTADTLRWRFVAGPITYRAVPTDAGYLIVRARRRGDAVELVVAHQIGAASPRSLRSVLAETMNEVGAHHALTPTNFPGTITTSRVGPVLTMRTIGSLDAVPQPIDWSPGDIELF